jgi:GxxExxY protein
MESELNQITERVIGAAIEVHQELGPGLLESAYEACLAHLLLGAGYFVERQKIQPIHFRGLELDEGYRLDLLVERKVLIELKAVERLLPVHEAQVLSYLKLSGCRVGLLINFHVPRLVAGLKRLML